MDSLLVLSGAPSHTKLVIHPSVPYALSWGVSIVAAGNDGQVGSFIDRNPNAKQDHLFFEGRSTQWQTGS